MKKLTYVMSVLMLLFFAGCGIKDAMDKLGKSAESIADSIEQVSDAATSLLNKINDISRLVDSKLESGEINQEVADMIDGRLYNLTQSIESAIQNTGGYMFDRLDGSVDNAFGELDILLDDLMAGVLGNYVPAIIDQVSSQMQLQINTITSSLEDLIILTAGQTVYVIDKTFNGLIITISSIILAIGLLVFALVFLRKGRKLTGAYYIGVGIFVIFLAFFLVIILVPSVRGKILTGFDYAAALDVKEVPPKITAVVPENIVLGKTRRIYIYGRHLNQLKNVSVKLTQGDQEKFTFPKSTQIVNTSNRIVLGNLDKELRWFVPAYPVFKQYMQEQGALTAVTENQAIQIGNALSKVHFSHIKPGVSVQPAVNVGGLHSLNMNVMAMTTPGSTPKALPVKLELNQVKGKTKDLVIAEVGTLKADRILDVFKNFFKEQYRIEEGDYGLQVIDDSVKIESPQFVIVSNPPPPVPDPDIFVMDMNWTGGVTPKNRQPATLDVTFGFTHPEAIARDFNARIVTVPTTTPLTINVPEGKIAAAKSGNRITVTSNPVNIDMSGNYSFACSVDDQNQIKETNESNNTFTKVLTVGEYVYDVTLDRFYVEPLSSAVKNGGEFTYSLVADAGGNPTSSCQNVINLNKDEITSLPCQFSFPAMKEGQNVMITFIPIMEISFGLMDFLNFTVNLGNVVWSKHLDVNPTGTGDVREYDILRETQHYKLHGKMTVTRKR